MIKCFLDYTLTFQQIKPEFIVEKLDCNKNPSYTLVGLIY